MLKRNSKITYAMYSENACGFKIGVIFPNPHDWSAISKLDVFLLRNF